MTAYYSSITPSSIFNPLITSKNINMILKVIFFHPEGDEIFLIPRSSFEVFKEQVELHAHAKFVNLI